MATKFHGSCAEGVFFNVMTQLMVTLPETNSLHLKMDRWNTRFLLGWPIFRGYVSFRECNCWFELVVWDSRGTPKNPNPFHFQ